MKATRQSIGRSVDQPANDVRLYLFHGPDDAQSRALGERLLQALGADRFLITSAAIKSDPAALVDEAGAMSLFGGARVMWIDPAGEEIALAAEALLAAPAVESPVVAIGGALRKTSALLKLVETGRNALAFASYPPEGADAARMVAEVGRRYGLKIAPELAAQLADRCANDQAIVAQELQKLALYVDASPHAPKALEAEAIEAVGADFGEGNAALLTDLALSGRLTDLAEELDQLPAGVEAIPVIRSLQRRLLMLASARSRVERGETPDDVVTSLGKSLFWKDKPIFARMLSMWNCDRLATASERIGQLERTLMFSPVPGRETLGEELIAIARASRRR